jgi:hypothetical protein
VLKKFQDACRGLWIGQDPNIINTILFDLASGGTGVLIGLSVCNESNRVICISAVRVYIPWCKQIRWLKVPLSRACAKFYSSLPMSDFPSLEGETILNHSLKPNSKLYPEDWPDGFLLGIGEEPIPDQYRDRQPFETHVSIYDGQNNEYHQDLRFQISRERKNSRHLKAYKDMVAARLAGRRSTLSEPEYAESCIREAVTQSGKTLGQIMGPNKKVGMRGRPDFSGENNSGTGNTDAEFSRDAGDASTNPPPRKVERDHETVTKSASGPGSESSKRRANRSPIKYLVNA